MDTRPVQRIGDSGPGLVRHRHRHAIHRDGGIVVGGRNIMHVKDGNNRVLFEKPDASAEALEWMSGRA